MTDPFLLFDEWLAEARASEVNDPEAMALATAGADGQPAVRMVLLKGHGPGGFIFYTNEQSAKGEQLAANARAALLLHWKSLRRQVRIEGAVERTSDAEADAYFATRARDSKLGAWASDQSRTLDDRATFEHRFEEAKAKFEGADVPRPPHWGGYRLQPDTWEFWQGRRSRLHDRLRYRLDGSHWVRERLAP